MSKEGDESLSAETRRRQGGKFNTEFYEIFHSSHNPTITYEIVCLDNALTRPPTDAIMVGAGKSDRLERVSTSNYGNRVHVHAWGEEVVTAGYGDLDDGGTPSDPHDDYTDVFGNTSAATAIVAGVVASIQGMYHSATLQTLGPRKMKKILIQSGLSQPGSPQEPIGPRVNLPGAVENLGLGIFTKVSGDQRDAGSISFGKLEHWKYNQFIPNEVPHDFLFLSNSQQVLRALQDFKPGTTEKYNEWFLLDIINHKIISVFTDPIEMTALFEPAHNASIHTDFITINQQDVGCIEFKDPWLRIDGDPKYYDPPYGYRNLGMAGAALEPYSQLPLQLFTSDSNFKGVFLDQEPDPIDPDIPYYSVAAPDQSLNGVTHFLEHWSGSGLEFEDAFAGTTAVIFRQNNAVVTAHMKAHLASNTNEATAFNNGRKVVEDDNGRFHLVYKDNGDIWYSNSTNNGTNWSNEERVSLSGNNTSPSIAYHTDIPYYGVVWDREESGNHFPVFRYKPI